MSCCGYTLVSTWTEIVDYFFFVMVRRPPRSTQGRSSAASDVYKRQGTDNKIRALEDLELDWFWHFLAADHGQRGLDDTGLARTPLGVGILAVLDPVFNRNWRHGAHVQLALAAHPHTAGER